MQLVDKYLWIYYKLGYIIIQLQIYIKIKETHNLLLINHMFKNLLIEWNKILLEKMVIYK
jgi:hypothetical protein